MKPDPSASSRLSRELGPVIATAVVVGTVIGSGVFQKPQDIAEKVPYFGLVALAWVLGGVLTLLGALTYAEVATLFPKAGGNYVFLREGYGRLAGFLWGWVEFFIIRSASLAALATMFSKSLHAVLRELAGREVLGYWPERVVTVAVILGLAAVNARGVKWGGVLQLAITLVKVGSLLVIIGLPLFVLFVPLPTQTAVPDLARLSPAWPAADRVGFGLFGGFFAAFLGVLWAYHGWMNIAPIAEEIKHPQRNIPLSLLLGVGILIFLYTGANFAYSLVLTPDEMKDMKERPSAAVAGTADETSASSFRSVPSEPHDETVAIGFARRLLGPAGVTLAAAAVMCSVFGALNGNLLVGPRLLYAMSEDGLAPPQLREVHAVYRTPVAATFVLAIWAACLVLGAACLTAVGLLSASQDHFNLLTNFAMFGAVIFETMAVLSIFVFRRRYPDAPRPYRCWGYPFVPILYAVIPALVLGNMFLAKWTEVIFGTLFIAAGIGVYFLVERRGAVR